MVPEAADFDRWVREISPESFVDDAFISVTWLRWLEKLFSEHGPVLRDDAEARGLEATVRAVSQALDAVLSDAEATHGKRPGIGVVVDDRSVRVVDRSSRQTEPPEGISTPDTAEALVAVADAVAELLAEAQGAPPFLCPTHNLGVHPRLVDGRPVWVCLPSGHVVAPIGSLGQPAN
jgi:hypothetical protein